MTVAPVARRAPVDPSTVSPTDPNRCQICGADTHAVLAIHDTAIHDVWAATVLPTLFR
jgi:hypothetical protein